MLDRVERLRIALREHQPRNDYERALQLQLAVVMPDVVTENQRQAAIAVLWKHQQADGGWSTRSMSDIDNWGDRMTAATRSLLESEPDVSVHF